MVDENKHVSKNKLESLGEDEETNRRICGKGASPVGRKGKRPFEVSPEPGHAEVTKQARWKTQKRQQQTQARYDVLKPNTDASQGSKQTEKKLMQDGHGE